MKNETRSLPISLARAFHVLTVFFVLLGTQFILPVNVLGRTVYLYYVEFLLVALFIGVAVTLLVKRQKPCLPLVLWVLPCIFIIWFFVLTAYRFFNFGDITGGFINFRVLTFPILFVLLLKQLKIAKKDLLFGIFLFATVMNIYQVGSIFISHSFRTVLALKNINIYLCFMLTLLPLLFFMLKTLSHPAKAVRILMRSLLVFNILSILVFTFFSGSRLTVVILPLSFFLGGLAVFGLHRCAFLKLGALFLAFIIISGTIMTLNLYDARYNVGRTYAEVFDILSIETPEKKPSSESENKDPSQNTESENTDSDNTDPVQDAKINVTESNSMRDLLWKKSVEYIKESPFWGRTSIDVEIEMTFFGKTEPVKVTQSPHNFILEMWLALGLPGLILYGTIILTVLIFILRKKTGIGGKIALFTILFPLFGFSFFQPLVTCYFAISLLLWLVLYLFEENEPEETNTV